MTTIRVEHAFQLTHDNGTVQTFAPGDHEVSDEVADHWYAQAHSIPALPKPEQLPPAAALGEAPPAHPQVIPPPPPIEGDAALYTNDGSAADAMAAQTLDAQALSAVPPNARTNPNKPVLKK